MLTQLRSTPTPCDGDLGSIPLYTFPTVSALRAPMYAPVVVEQGQGEYGATHPSLRVTEWARARETSAGGRSGANRVSWPLPLASVFASMEAVSPVRCALNQKLDNDLLGCCPPQTSGSKHTRGETRAKRARIPLAMNLKFVMAAALPAPHLEITPLIWVRGDAS